MTSQPRTPEPGSDARRAAPPALALQSGLGFRLSRLTRALRRTWADQLSGLGLSPPQAAVVRGVAGSPGCSVRELARVLGADPMNAKRCVDELEGRGLLRSGSRPGDRRPRVLTLTEEGEALAREVDCLVREQETWLDTGLGPVERGHVEAALSTLESLLDLPAGLPGPVASNPVPTGRPRRARPSRPRSTAPAATIEENP